MKYKYDPEGDILLITFSDEKPAYGEITDNIIVHYNEKNKVIELEILGGTKTALKIIRAILTRKAITA